MKLVFIKIRVKIFILWSDWIINWTNSTMNYKLLFYSISLDIIKKSAES